MLTPPPQLARKASSDLQQRPKRQKTRSASLASNASSAGTAAPSPPQITATSFPALTVPSTASDRHSSRENAPYGSQIHASVPQAGPSAVRNTDRPTSTITELQTGGCGMCDKTASTSCICEEIGIAVPASVQPLQPLRPALAIDPNPATTNDSCGLCDDTAATSCICEDMGLKESKAGMADPSARRKPHVAGCGFCEADAAPCVCKEVGLSPSSPVPPKDLTMAVPLRSIRKSVTGSTQRTIWRLDNKQPMPVSPAPQNPAPAREALRRTLIKAGSRLQCSGDPKTCPACADDP